MLLYHISEYSPKGVMLLPEVPSCIQYVSDEEPTIERICLAPTIQQCMSAIDLMDRIMSEYDNYEEIGEKALYEVYEDQQGCKNLRLFQPYIMYCYEFDVSAFLDSIVPTEYIISNFYVPDARVTQEHWCTKPLPFQKVYELHIDHLTWYGLQYNTYTVEFDDENGQVLTLPREETRHHFAITNYNTKEVISYF